MFPVCYLEIRIMSLLEFRNRQQSSLVVKPPFGLENYSYRRSLVPVLYYLTDSFVFVAVIVCTHKMTISVDASARKGELSHPASSVFICADLQ